MGGWLVELSGAEVTGPEETEVETSAVEAGVEEGAGVELAGVGGGDGKSFGSGVGCAQAVTNKAQSRPNVRMVIIFIILNLLDKYTK